MSEDKHNNFYILDTTNKTSRLFENFKGSGHKFFGKHQLDHILYENIIKIPSMIVVVRYDNECNVCWMKNPIFGEGFVWEGDVLTSSGCCIIYCNIPYCCSFTNAKPLLLVDDYDLVLNNYRMFFEQNKGLSYYSDCIISVFQKFSSDMRHTGFLRNEFYKRTNDQHRKGFLNYCGSMWKCEITDAYDRCSTVFVPRLCAIETSDFKSMSIEVDGNVYNVNTRRSYEFFRINEDDFKGNGCECCIL